MIANKNAQLEVERATKGMTEQEKSTYMLNRAIELQKKKLGLTKESIPKDQVVVDVYEDTKKQLDGLVSSTEQYSSGVKNAEDILSDYESQLQNVSTSINGTNGSTQQLVDLQGQLKSLTDNTTTSMTDLTAIMGTYGTEGTLADSIAQVGDSAGGLEDSFTGIRDNAIGVQASFIGVNTEIKGIPDNLFLSQEAAVNAGIVIGAKTDLMQTNFMNVTGKVAGLKTGVDNLKQSVDNLSDKTITITTIYKTKYETEGSSSKTNTTTKPK
jgi:hypothetical protein